MHVLVDVSKARSVPDGARLFELGDAAGDRGYVLLEGTVEIRKPDAPVLEAEAPDLLGEIKQISPQQARTATVTAKGELKVLKFSWQELFQAAEVVLSPTEMDQLKKGIEKVAWSHVTE